MRKILLIAIFVLFNRFNTVAIANNYSDAINYMNEGYFKEAKELIDEGYKDKEDINEIFSFENVLMAAARLGNAELVKLIISYNADLNIKIHSSGYRKNVNTPLYDAVESGNLEVVKILVESGANLNDLNDYYEASYDTSLSPVMLANLKKYKKIADYLISKGARTEAAILKEREINKKKYAKPTPIEPTFEESTSKVSSTEQKTKAKLDNEQIEEARADEQRMCKQCLKTLRQRHYAKMSTEDCCLIIHAGNLENAMVLIIQSGLYGQLLKEWSECTGNGCINVEK